MGIPVVTVAMGAPREGALNVRIDDHAAAAEMTRHLLELGHRSIGFIKGHPNHVASHDRYRGFCDALGESGLDPAEMPPEPPYLAPDPARVAAWAERLTKYTAPKIVKSL